jgi:hypothetical protein
VLKIWKDRALMLSVESGMVSVLRYGFEDWLCSRQLLKYVDRFAKIDYTDLTTMGSLALGGSTKISKSY